MDVVIEQLVTKLVADVQQYLAGMSSATAAAQQTAAQVQQYSKQVESFSGSITTFARQAGSALMALGAGAWLAGARGSFQEAETSLLKLQVAIQAGGHDVTSTLANYRAFAQSIQAVTTASQTDVLAQLRRAESYGLSGEAAKAAVKNAIALASVTDADAESMLRLTAALANGNIAQAMHMARLVPQLRGITDETLFIAKATALMNLGWQQATVEGGTVGAQINRLWQSLGQVNKQIGQTVSEAIQPLVAVAQQAVTWFLNLDPAARKAAVAVGALAAGFILLKPALSILAPLLGAGLGVVASPFGALAVGAVLAAKEVVDAFGGLDKTWDAIKTGAAVAWQAVKDGWAALVVAVKPITDALVDLFSATWQAVKDGARAVAGYVSDAWVAVKDAFASTGIDPAAVWEGIRDTVVTVINVITSVVKNLGVIIGAVWENVAAGAKVAWGYVSEAATTGTNAVVGFVSANRDTIETVALLAGGLLVAYGAFHLVAAGVVLVNGVLASMGVYQVASAAGWLAWKAVVIGAQVVTTLFTAQLVVWKFAVGATTFATALLAAAMTTTGLVTVTWSGAAGIATAATWLWNASLAALNTLLAPATILAVAGTVAVLGTTFTVVAGAVWGVWQAAGALVSILGNLPTSTGPVQAIGAMFSELGGILRDVWRAFSIDSDIAWRLLQAGAALAISQVKDLWPPLWTFISDGFVAVWNAMSAIAGANFDLVVLKAQKAAAKLREYTLWGANADTSGIDKQFTELEASAERLKSGAIAGVQKQLQGMADNFKVPMSEATRAAREAVEGIRKELEVSGADKLAKQWSDFWQPFPDGVPKSPDLKKQTDAAVAAGQGIGDAMSKGFAHSSWTAALSGSAEAVARIEEFRNRLTAPLEGVASPAQDLATAGKSAAADIAGAAQKLADAGKAAGDAIANGDAGPDSVAAPGGVFSDVMAAASSLAAMASVYVGEQDVWLNWATGQVGNWVRDTVKSATGFSLPGQNGEADAGANGAAGNPVISSPGLFGDVLAAASTVADSVKAAVADSGTWLDQASDWLKAATGLANLPNVFPGTPATAAPGSGGVQDYVPVSAGDAGSGGQSVWEKILAATLEQANLARELLEKDPIEVQEAGLE